MEKSAIRFEPLVQKGETNEQMTSAIYFFYSSTNNFIGAYARRRKTLAKTPLPRQDRIIAIFRKRVLKEAVGGAKEKFEIAAILNNCKDTLDDFMNSLDAKSLEASKSKNAPISARPDLEEDHLDKNGRG